MPYLHSLHRLHDLHSFLPKGTDSGEKATSSSVALHWVNRTLGGDDACVIAEGERGLIP